MGDGFGEPVSPFWLVASGLEAPHPTFRLSCNLRFAAANLMKIYGEQERGPSENGW